MFVWRCVAGIFNSSPPPKKGLKEVTHLPFCLADHHVVQLSIVLQADIPQEGKEGTIQRIKIRELTVKWQDTVQILSKQKAQQYKQENTLESIEEPLREAPEKEKNQKRTIPEDENIGKLMPQQRRDLRNSMRHA